MGYFSNGTEGELFYSQCSKCKYGDKPCPIALVQFTYNYDQANDSTGTAAKILDTLVNDNGVCSMYEIFESDFAIDPRQMSLFPEYIPDIKHKEP